jgi:hypothetical protein
VCPNGDYQVFGLPPSFSAVGFVAPVYALTWALSVGAFTGGPVSATPPAPGLTTALAMLYNGAPVPASNWSPIQARLFEFILYIFN